MDERILTWTTGSLSLKDSQWLNQLAADVPAGGTVLDLNCGAGRSTVCMATALRKSVTITAIDSHVTNPLSTSPYLEGSLLAFLETIRRFKVTDRVIPVVSPVHLVERVINKRSANLIVVQSPVTITPSLNEDAMCHSIELAKYAIRRGGIIIVCCPNPVYRPQFDRMVEHQFRGLARVCIQREALVGLYV